MKIKTFILTLLLMSCPFLFGQHWTPTKGGAENMITTVQINIANVAQTSNSFEIGAFIGETCCGSARIDAEDGVAYLSITKPDNTDNTTISFKLYNHDTQKVYVLNDELPFSSDNTTITLNTFNTDAVAETNDLIYETLADAIAAAKAGETVTLLESVEVSSALALEKSLTIDLNGKTVEGTANRLFRITAASEVTISNGTILNEVLDGRCIETRTGNVTLNLNEVELIAENGASQPLTVGGSGNNIKVNAISSTISAGTGYGITTFNPVVMTLDDTEVSGFGALNIKVASSSVGSAGSTFNIVNGSELIGTNNAAEGESNSFCTVMVEDKNVTINVEGSTLKAVAKNNSQTIFGFGNEYVTEAITGVDINVAVGSTLTLTAEGENKAAIIGFGNGQVLGDNSITVPAVDYAEQLKAEGWVVSVAVDGLVTVLGTPVAAIGETKYHTLAAAIKAATSVQPIKLLANVTENVTVNKSVKIDGDGKNYTGTMTVNDVTATFENINFVKGQVYKNKNTGLNANITIKNCTFDGQDMDAYAINLGGTGSIVIEDVTAKDYGYGLLQVTSSCAGLTVKNVKISGCYYGLKVDYANAVSLENVKIADDVTLGIYDSNYGTKTYKIKNCDLSAETPIKIWERNQTNYTTFEFEGVSTVPTLPTSKFAKIVAGAQVGTKIYGDFAEAYAAVPADGTIKMYNNAEIETTLNVPHSLTIDGNGNTLTYTGSGASARAITVESTANGANLTVKNLTVDCTASYCQRGINYNTNGELTLEGVIVKGTNVTYALNLPGSSDGAEIEITDSRLKGNIALNVWGENTIITTTNSHFTSVDENAAENYAAIAFNNDGNGTSCAGTTIVMDGGSIKAYDEKGEPSVAVRNSAAVNFEAGVNYSVNNETEIVGTITAPVALVKYEGHDQFYSCATLQAAIDKVVEDKSGYVLLVANETSDKIIEIKGDVVIDLNGKTVEGTANRLFRITAASEVTISNGTILNEVLDGRCIETRTGNVTLNLNEVELIAENGASQPLTVGGSGNNIKVNATSSTISAGTGYGITTFNPVEMTLDDTDVSGYAALNIKVASGSVGSAGSVFNIKNGSELVGTNNANEGESNGFSTVMVEDKDITINVEGSTLKADAQNNNQVIFAFGNSLIETPITDVKINVDVNSILTLSASGENKAKILGFGKYQVLGNNLVTVPVDYAEQLKTEGYATSEVENGLVTVLGKAVAKVNETLYTTLEAAFAAAKNNETVTMLADVELATSDSNGAFEIAVGRKLTLDLNGKNITAGARTGYTGRTQYAFDNYADLTITGKGTITSRGIQNYGTLTINSADVKVIACDTNGGACVWGYAGSITNISAGTFENIDGESGIINTAGELNVTGGTFTQKGTGTTYAIICENKATFENATITGIHGVIGAISNANVTITSGTYTLVGVTGQSDHNVYTEDNAKVTINGGTFTCNEKDAGGKTLCGTTTSIVATGGSFDEDVEEYCAEGFGSVKSAENVWMVKPAQTRTLNTGWSWYSHYVVASEYESVLTQLQNEIGNNGIQIKAATDKEGYLQYDNGNGWFGDLTTTSPAKMYKIKVTEGQDVKVVGDIVDPELCEISLVGGDKWNWIGFPIAIEEGINIKAALSGIQAKDNDIIKSQDEFAQYSATADKWYGSLKSLQPGQGYMYDRKGANTEFTFAYPTSKTSVEANITTENNYWVPVDQYANNMTMIATLDIENENYELAAFVNGEVRGSARPIYVDAFDAYMFFLTIHGDNVEEVSFMCYDLNTNTEFSLNERINYSNDAILGSIEEPYALRGTVGMGEVSANTIAVYPNPTTTGNDINLATTCDKVEVFNALGVKVAEYQNVDTIDALEAAGIYVIRITNNDNVQNCRLVVK